MISNDKYAKAYTEVLEIISHFPQEEIDRIPKEKIDFYKENMDKNYEFKINPEIDLSEQNVSREANALIIMLYKDYFATEEQIKAIDQKLMENEKKIEKEKRNKYNPDDLFKKIQTANKENENNFNNDSENIESLNKTEINTDKQLIEYKENFFTRFKKFILKLLHINE